ncbi:MAG: hypothetical protein DIU75_015300 [Mycolicibacterium hassiacum]
MRTKRSAPVRGGDERRRTARGTRRGSEAPTRRNPARDQRPLRSAPQTTPIPRPADKPVRPKTTSQARARAKARKAKAPKVVRPPLRERLLTRLATAVSSIELSPRALLARVPFVVLVIGSIGVGLGLTLWLSTDAAERSYRLGSARELNQALLQQKEALERDVLRAQAAPALAEKARELGMIPSRETAHLVQDPAGNWVVVGTPKPAEGVPPPPLNTPLPDDPPPPPPTPPAPRVVDPREVTVRIPPRSNPAQQPGTAPQQPGTVGQPPGTVPLTAPLPGTGTAPLEVPTPVAVPHAADGPLAALGPVPEPAPQAPPPQTAPAPAAPAADGAVAPEVAVPVPAPAAQPAPDAVPAPVAAPPDGTPHDPQLAATPGPVGGEPPAAPEPTPGQPV